MIVVLPPEIEKWKVTEPISNWLDDWNACILNWGDSRTLTAKRTHTHIHSRLTLLLAIDAREWTGVVFLSFLFLPFHNTCSLWIYLICSSFDFEPQSNQQQQQRREREKKMHLNQENKQESCWVIELAWITFTDHFAIVEHKSNIKSFLA